MADYVTNGDISAPIYLPELNPDVDLGGLKFSYQWGPFYLPTSDQIPIKMPPPFAGSS